MNDFSSLPVGGGLILAVALYIGLSMLATGPLVAERSIEKLGWSQMCEANLRAEISARKSPKRIIPKFDCNSIFGVWHPEFRKICNQHGNPNFGGPASSILETQEKMRQELEERRLSHAASKSLTRCSCAATIVASDRVPWATHAGSLRLVTPPQVRNLKSELVRALHSPHCQQKG